MSTFTWIHARLVTTTLGLQAQNSFPASVLRGEIDGGGLSPDKLMVEVVKQGKPAERAPVMADGSFEIRGLADGQYELRVINLYGDVVRRQFVSVPDQSRSLVLRLSDRVEQRPISGTVSVKRLLAPVPTKAEKEFVRAQKTYREGKLQESVQHLRKAIQIHPDYMEAHNNLGVRYMQLNEIERAASEFRQAVEIDPASVLGQTNLALALASLQRYRDAEVMARRALSVDPDFVQARYALGLSLAAQDECSIEAIQNLQRASERYLKARLGVARLRACRGEIDQAAAELRAYLSSPNAEDRPQIESWLTRLVPPAKH